MGPAMNNDGDFPLGPNGDGTLQHVISFSAEVKILETYIQAWTGNDQDSGKKSLSEDIGYTSIMVGSTQPWYPDPTNNCTAPLFDTGFY